MYDSLAALSAIFATSLVVGLSGALSPGPLLALCIRESASRGFAAGPLLSTGHALLELLVVVALAKGLSQVLSQPSVVAAVGIGGGLFLLWMAWGMARSPAQLSIQGTPKPEASPARLRGPVLLGALVSLSNPFWFIWWVTVGSAFIVRSFNLGAAGIAAFYLGHILADYTWYSAVAATVASGRRLLTPRLYRGLMLACAALIAALGSYFITASLRTLAQA